MARDRYSLNGKRVSGIRLLIHAALRGHKRVTFHDVFADETLTVCFECRFAGGPVAARAPTEESQDG